MKNTLSSLLLVLPLLCLTKICAAQSLEFSQVMMISSTEDTVPAGKVWKLTAMTSTAFGVVNVGAAPFGYEIFVDGASTYIGHSAMSENDMAMPAYSWMPFWFPAGTRLRAGANVARLSIIEFTVVP